MAERRRPSAPKGLQPRGRAFWRATVDVYDLTPGELELLAELCRSLDDADRLRAVVDADGATTAGSKGQTVVHPCLAELRQVRLTVGRLLGQLALPDPEGGTVLSPAQLRGRRAAQSRWAARDRMTEGRRLRGPAA